MDSICQSCGQAGRTCVADFRRTFGVLVFSQTSVTSGAFCQACAERVCNSHQLFSAALGWWSVYGPVTTATCLRQNRATRLRLRKQFASPPSAAPTRALPWAKYLGIPAETGVGELQLTWPIGLGALCVFALVVSGFISAIVITEHRGPVSARMWAAAACGMALPVLGLLGCVAWHRRTHPRPGTIPDLLSELIPPSLIYQADAAQIAGVITQLGSAVRLILIVQNVAEADLRFGCTVLGGASGRTLAAILPAGAVAVYTLDELVRVESAALHVRFPLSFEAQPGRARRGKHYPREALTTRGRQQLMSAALAARGHFSLGGDDTGPGTGLAFMNKLGEADLLALPPSGPTPPGPFGVWTERVIGQRHDTADLAAPTEAILRALSIPASRGPAMRSKS